MRLVLKSRNGAFFRAGTKLSGKKPAQQRTCGVKIVFEEKERERLVCICEIEKVYVYRIERWPTSRSLNSKQYNVFQQTLWPKKPLLDLIIFVKVQTKAGPTSSSNRDSPSQGHHSQRLDLDRDRERTGQKAGRPADPLAPNSTTFFSRPFGQRNLY